MIQGLLLIQRQTVFARRWSEEGEPKHWWFRKRTNYSKLCRVCQWKIPPSLHCLQRCKPLQGLDRKRTSWSSIQHERQWLDGSTLFLDWFKKMFLPDTHDVFDGHFSHLSLDLVELAKTNNVDLLRLPAHLTHHLQPLDWAVFRPIKMK